MRPGRLLERLPQGPEAFHGASGQRVEVGPVEIAPERELGLASVAVGEDDDESAHNARFRHERLDGFECQSRHGLGTWCGLECFDGLGHRCHFDALGPKSGLSPSSVGTKPGPSLNEIWRFAFAVASASSRSFRVRRAACAALPPRRPAARASSDENVWAVPAAWAALPPLLAISLTSARFIPANPLLSLCGLGAVGVHPLDVSWQWRHSVDALW